MPASGIRFVMTIKDDRYSISEVHVVPGVDLEAAVPKAIRLFKTRMALCGVPAVPFRGRLSVIGKRKVVRTLSQTELKMVGQPTLTTYTGPGGSAGTNESDQPKASIQVVFRKNDGTENSGYLGGVPDPVIRENPEGPAIELVPAYQALFDAYRSELLTTGWGCIAKVKDDASTKLRSVMGMETNLNTSLSEVFSASFAPELGVGTKIFLRGMKPQQRAFRALTGQWEVYTVTVNSPVAGQSRYALRDSKGYNLLDAKALGTVELVDYTFASYVDVKLGQQTTRKRGNRSLASPGRRLKPVRVSL